MAQVSKKNSKVGFYAHALGFDCMHSGEIEGGRTYRIYQRLQVMPSIFDPLLLIFFFSSASDMCCFERLRNVCSVRISEFSLDVILLFEFFVKNIGCELLLKKLVLFSLPLFGKYAGYMVYNWNCFFEVQSCF